MMSTGIHQKHLHALFAAVGQLLLSLNGFREENAVVVDMQAHIALQLRQRGEKYAVGATGLFSWQTAINVFLPPPQ
jgi:hypothetical protein